MAAAQDRRGRPLQPGPDVHRPAGAVGERHTGLRQLRHRRPAADGQDVPAAGSAADRGPGPSGEGVRDRRQGHRRPVPLRALRALQRPRGPSRAGRAGPARVPWAAGGDETPRRRHRRAAPRGSPGEQGRLAARGSRPAGSWAWSRSSSGSTRHKPISSTATTATRTPRPSATSWSPSPPTW